MRRFFTGYTICLTISLITVAFFASAQVQFSRPGGQYTDPFNLELESNDGAQNIYYTTDGSQPDQNAQQYNGPINIQQTVVVRAQAHFPGDSSGEVQAQVYTRLGDDVTSFDSDLPLMIVHQFDAPIVEEERTIAYLSVLDPHQNGRTQLSGEVSLQSRILTNVRGTSSASLPKQQYAVRLVDDEDENRNDSLLGLPEENNWVLHAPYDDKTLIRNAFAYELHRDMGWYSPHTKFVEVFLHEGNGPVTMDHYNGVYMLTERIKWDDNRLNIDKISADDNEEPEITGGYIFVNDRDVHLTTDRGSEFSLKRPQDWDITDQQRDWLSGHLSDFETALFGNNFTDQGEGYPAYINTKSFIDYHLITEFFKEADGYQLSAFMHKDRNRKIVMGPLWDFNLSMGNVSFREGDDSEGWLYDAISEEEYFYGWYNRLFEDPEFEERYVKRWWELRETVLSEEHLLETIDRYVDLLQESQERNFERWDILGESIWGFWADPPGIMERTTYQAEIDYMVDFMQQRLAWMDQQMGAPQEPSSLIHYWYFNDDMENDVPLETVDAFYSNIDGGEIVYHSSQLDYPASPEDDNFRKASMERRNEPTILNYRPKGNDDQLYNKEDMRGLQVRQPFEGTAGTNYLVLELPTTAHRHIEFSFAAKDEGAAEKMIIHYAVGEEGNRQWQTTGLAQNELDLYDSYRVYTLDFTDIAEVNDNEHFAVRISFQGNDMMADDGDRVTLNNIALEGEQFLVTGLNEEQDKTSSIQNYPNPFASATTVVYTLDAAEEVQLTLYDAHGRKVADLAEEHQPAGEHEYVIEENLASGVYYCRLITSQRQQSLRIVKK